MSAERFDAIVVGGGQAGPSLAVRLADAGRSVAIVERRHLGGTCINYGCRPTKALIASAKVAAMARRAAEYGIAAGPVAADMAAVRARELQASNASRRTAAAELPIGRPERPKRACS